MHDGINATRELKGAGEVWKKKWSFPAVKEKYKIFREDKAFKLDDKGEMAIRQKHTRAY